MGERRTAWVTGGSRGIGRATALRLGKLDMDVAVGYHTRRDDAQSVVGELEGLGVNAIAVGGDMSRLNEVEGMCGRIDRTMGPVDVLVVSHGIYTRTPFADLTFDKWKRTIDVNLDGAYLATLAVVPGMRKRRYGRVIYLGSAVGRTGSTQGVHYGASKAALLGLARSLAQEVSSDGVTVNVVSPSMIDTDILGSDTPEKRLERERSIPVGRIGTPDEVAAAIAYLVSDEAAYVTGTELRVDGGFMMG